MYRTGRGEWSEPERGAPRLTEDSEKHRVLVKPGDGRTRREGHAWDGCGEGHISWRRRVGADVESDVASLMMQVATILLSQDASVDPRLTHPNQEILIS